MQLRSAKPDQSPTLQTLNFATGKMLAMVIMSSSLLLAACSKPRENVWQGYVEGEYVTISTSESGRLDHLSVARGQQIKTGAVLFALESGDETAARQQALRQLQAAEAQLTDIQSGKRPQEISITQARLLQAQAMAKKAQLQLTRDEMQFQVGGVSKQQVDDSRSTAENTAAQVRQWQSQLAVDRLPNREAQIRAQQEQVAASQAALAQAQWRLDQKTVSATRTGLIFDTLYREGEWVAAGNPVVRMLPPENVKIRFFVPEPVLGKLKLNQTVTLQCDGCLADLPASISYIAANAEFTPPIIYSNESRAKLVYMIEAHPSMTDAPKLHPGQPLEVRLP